MSAADEFTWLEHTGTADSDGHGGRWQCPNSAVGMWLAMGWEPCEAPEEHNPVVAENLAAQQAEADRVSAEATDAAAEKKAAKAAGKSDTTTSEGN